MSDNATRSLVQFLPAATDRDAMVAIFTAVAGLAEKLTGQKLTVYVQTEAGYELALTGGRVEWSSATATEASGAAGPAG